MRNVVIYLRYVAQAAAMAAAAAIVVVGAWLPAYFSMHFTAQAGSVMLGIASSAGKPMTVFVSALAFVAAS